MYSPNQLVLVLSVSGTRIRYRIFTYERKPKLGSVNASALTHPFVVSKVVRKGPCEDRCQRTVEHLV